jgi:hypothetical protein
VDFILNTAGCNFRQGQALATMGLALFEENAERRVFVVAAISAAMLTAAWLLAVRFAVESLRGAPWVGTLLVLVT